MLNCAAPNTPTPHPIALCNTYGKIIQNYQYAEHYDVAAHVDSCNITSYHLRRVFSLCEYVDSVIPVRTFSDRLCSFQSFPLKRLLIIFLLKKLLAYIHQPVEFCPKKFFLQSIVLVGNDRLFMWQHWRSLWMYVGLHPFYILQKACCFQLLFSMEFNSEYQ